MGRFRFFHVLMLALACLVLTPQAEADTISGTVKDPSGGVVIGARIEINGGSLVQPLVLASDESGKFAAPNLEAGKYEIRVAKEGFDNIVTEVDLHGTADLALSLKITAPETRITVSEKSTAFANSDAAYRQLRDIGLGDTYRCENFTFSVDIGSFELKTGTITFLSPVNKLETGAVFVGQGHFTLKPLTAADTNEMARRAGGPTAEEDYTDVVFRSTPGEYSLSTAVLGSKTGTPAETSNAFQHWREKLRHRHEIPEGLTQAFLESETIDNVDADVLAAIYNPKHPPFFNAYMHGSPHKDLRFFVRARVGALPQFDSPEEVALVNCDGGGTTDGIWDSQHLKSELTARTASSQEDRRRCATPGHKIETVIGKNNH